MNHLDKAGGLGKAVKEGVERNLPPEKVSRIGVLAEANTVFVDAVINRYGADLHEPGDPDLDAPVAELLAARAPRYADTAANLGVRTMNLSQVRPTLAETGGFNTGDQDFTNRGINPPYLAGEVERA